MKTDQPAFTASDAAAAQGGGTARYGPVGATADRPGGTKDGEGRPVTANHLSHRGFGTCYSSNPQRKTGEQ